MPRFLANDLVHNTVNPKHATTKKHNCRNSYDIASISFILLHVKAHLRDQLFNLKMPASFVLDQHNSFSIL